MTDKSEQNLSSAVKMLSKLITEEIFDLSRSPDPDVLTKASIQRIVDLAVGGYLSGLSFPNKLRLLASDPDLESAKPEMQTLRFTIGEHVDEVLSHALHAGLSAGWRAATLAGYQGRVLGILKGVEEIASVLDEGPASRCYNPENLPFYSQVLREIEDDFDQVSNARLNEMLGRGCDFFVPLSNCLLEPEFGEPVGITEETVGYSGAEIEAWFAKISDLQSFCQHDAVPFRKLLEAELEVTSVSVPRRT